MNKLRIMAAAAIVFWKIGVVLCVACPMGTAWAIGQSWDGADPGINVAGTASGAVRRPMHAAYITGIVTMEDGSSVPAGAIIESICNGLITGEALVASDGRFSLQIGGSSVLRGLLPDLTGCEMRACLPGYRSSRVILDGVQTMGQISDLTLMLVPVEKARGTVVSATDLSAPKRAKKALKRAQNALRKNKPDEAEKQLKAALEAHPNYAAAWTELGQVFLVTRRIPEARKACESAIAADDRFVHPYLLLARLAAMEQNWQEAADVTDQALQLDPVSFPEGYFFNSVAHYNLNNFEAAERSARRAQRLDPRHRIPQTCIVLANILEQRNDVAGAAEQLRTYLAIAPRSPHAPQARAWLQRLEELSGLRAAGNP